MTHWGSVSFLTFQLACHYLSGDVSVCPIFNSVPTRFLHPSPPVPCLMNLTFRENVFGKGHRGGWHRCDSTCLPRSLSLFPDKAPRLRFLRALPTRHQLPPSMAFPGFSIHKDIAQPRLYLICQLIIRIGPLWMQKDSASSPAFPVQLSLQGQIQKHTLVVYTPQSKLRSLL